MHCPECGAEVRPELDRCDECDVALVDEAPPGEDPEATPFAVVFATSEIDVIPVIKSLLRGAGIPFETDGEAMMDLFPSDMLGPVMNRPRGEVRFMVPEAQAEEARELLAAEPIEGDPVVANKELWDAWTEVNAKSDFYDVEAFRAGASSLKPVELDELGDVRGKTLLHLQCHFGLDTLSWARLGARVTGVDFSEASIELARDLAAELDLPARFVCADVLRLTEHLEGEFDLVFTSYGVLEWLRDLETWARVIASFLKPGGSFHMVEFHPLALTFSDDGRPFHHDYLPSPEPIQTVEHGSYADRDADLTGVGYAWSHSLGEIVTALAAAGLRLEHLRELTESPYDCYDFTEEVEPGKAVVRGYEGKVPLLFSLKATR